MYAYGPEYSSLRIYPQVIRIIELHINTCIMKVQATLLIIAPKWNNIKVINEDVMNSQML